jgi:NAD(P)-dependent dehydrogenase (short-subunit alcohol dehydrogenase family)
VLAARTQGDLDETDRLAGQTALRVPCDVANPEAIERLVARASERFARIDAVVHSAGVAPMLSIEQVTPQRWREVVDVNLSAAVFLARAVWPIFRAQKSGVIVNVSSFSARDPFPGLGVYGAAKGGMNVLGLALAREGAPHGIRVHTVAPAAVETQMFRKLVPPERYPTEKTLAPQDVAHVIGQCVAGDLRYASGEVIWLQKRPA